jgi:hypothetical protein
MTNAESWELDTICMVIVSRVYASVGSRLGSQEIARLAADLASEILLSIYLHADQPQDEIAWDATGTFLRRRGIVEAGDGECWAWVN